MLQNILIPSCGIPKRRPEVNANFFGEIHFFIEGDCVDGRGLLLGVDPPWRWVEVGEVHPCIEPK